MRTAARQRGVALIMAMLMVALAVILATQIGFDGALERQRTTTVLMQEQAFQIGLGAEAWAASYLRDDLQQDRESPPGQDHLAETWATPIPPIPIEGGMIEGQIEDLQGRFNVNTLLLGDEVERQHWLKAFERLLVALELEPRWAGILQDWMDGDRQPAFPDGAEDGEYLAMAPPYRPPNTMIASISELLALPQFGLERYNKLKPYITALPVDNTELNVCTASGIVIDALTEGRREYGVDPENLTRAREEECFPSAEVVRAVLPPDARDMIGETSSWFRLSAYVTIGGSEFSLYSLLYRTGDGRVRVLMRSLAPE